MRNFLTAFVVLAALAFAGFEGFHAYKWKHYADERNYLSERSALYLFGPSGVIGPDGKELSRQQILDSYLHQLIEKSPGYKFKE